MSFKFCIQLVEIVIAELVASGLQPGRCVHPAQPRGTGLHTLPTTGIPLGKGLPLECLGLGQLCLYF